jgi:hypothetical protein
MSAIILEELLRLPWYEWGEIDGMERPSLWTPWAIPGFVASVNRLKSKLSECRSSGTPVLIEAVGDRELVITFEV